MGSYRARRSQSRAALTITSPARSEPGEAGDLDDRVGVVGAGARVVRRVGVEPAGGPPSASGSPPSTGRYA
jgi:hypothetical protein